MHPASERDVHLKYGKRCGSEQSCSGEPLGGDILATCDEERYGDHDQRERPPDDHPLERKHSIRQMNVCHKAWESIIVTPRLDIVLKFS